MPGTSIRMAGVHWRPFAVASATLLGLVGLWYGLGVQGRIGGPSGVPTLESVASAAASWARHGRFQEDIPISLRRALLGITLGSLAGIAVGLLTGRIRAFYWMVGPPFHYLRALPAVALAPLLLIVLGLSEGSRLAIISLGVFFPVWINAHEGSGQVDARFLEVARDLSFGRLQTFRQVVLPAALPFVVAGIRTGIAIAYIMVFIAEWIGASRGIGYRLSIAYTLSSTDHMVVGLFVLGALAFLTDALFRLTVRWIFPWLDKT